MHNEPENQLRMLRTILDGQDPSLMYLVGILNMMTDQIYLLNDIQGMENLKLDLHDMQLLLTEELGERFLLAYNSLDINADEAANKEEIQSEKA